MSKPKIKILTVKEILGMDLKIPPYQRPYKWTEKNVRQLISDIVEYQNKKQYRLGTIVLHKDSEGKNIVDGQQRITTILLIVKALEEIDKLSKLEININPSYKSDISKKNIYNNYNLIKQLIKEFDGEFLLEKCEFVVFTLNDISEAFQFFDSQNSRGKDLEPHDLLKAYHLREMGSDFDEEEKIKIVEKWENYKSEELSELFEKYMYRIRNWIKGEKAFDFSKQHIDLFKGIKQEKLGVYPCTEQLSIVNGFYKDDFPFQLDQTIINGGRFFEMVSHYKDLIDKNINYTEESNFSNLTETAQNILETINNYSGRWRTGDKYVRSIFNCLLIYYIDKFATKEGDKLSQIIEKIFIYAYTLRLKQLRVMIQSMNNYVVYVGKYPNPFNLLKNSFCPNDFIKDFNLVQLDGIRFDNIDEKIRKLFDNYFNTRG